MGLRHSSHVNFDSLEVVCLGLCIHDNFHTVTNFSICIHVTTHISKIIVNYENCLPWVILIHFNVKLMRIASLKNIDGT